MMQALLDVDISTRRGIATAHIETTYNEYSKGLSFPVSEDASDRSIVIPLYCQMTQEEINYVIEHLKH